MHNTLPMFEGNFNELRPFLNQVSKLLLIKKVAAEYNTSHTNTCVITYEILQIYANKFQCKWIFGTKIKMIAFRLSSSRVCNTLYYLLPKGWLTHFHSESNICIIFIKWIEMVMRSREDFTGVKRRGILRSLPWDLLPVVIYRWHLSCVGPFHAYWWLRFSNMNYMHRNIEWCILCIYDVIYCIACVCG